MKIGKVIGNVVATRKNERLVGHKLLVVRSAESIEELKSSPLGSCFVAVDLVGAGPGEIVIYSSGSSARSSTGFTDSPIDAAIVGIVDQVDISE
jgi:ethanolamine utilization protein EutN